MPVPSATTSSSPSLSIDQESGEWWGKWKAALDASDGVLVVKTEAYEQKLAYGVSKQAEGGHDAPGKGIYREVEAILQRRDESGDEFKVFVLNPMQPGQTHNDLRVLLEDGESTANIDVLKALFSMSAEEAAAPRSRV